MTNKSVDGNNMINTRDCLQRAWNNTMELVRDFEMYSKGVEDSEVKSAFKDMAEKQGKMAQDLREMFNRYNQES